MQDIDDEDMAYDLDLGGCVPYGRGKSAAAAMLADRAGTHWDGCYAAGSRHWPCAVAEANRQRTRAEQAERERDAWQRSASQWHDAADAAQAARDRIMVAYDEAMERLDCIREKLADDCTDYNRNLLLRLLDITIAREEGAHA